jgi:hypothetical protein
MCDTHRLSIFLAMPAGLLILYQHSMRHEGPIRVFWPLKFGRSWSRKDDKDTSAYHPPMMDDEGINFLHPDIHYKLPPEERLSGGHGGDDPTGVLKRRSHAKI